MAERPGIQIFVCEDPEAMWHRLLAWEFEREAERYELEQAHEANASLHAREPDMWAERAATDPYWPPPEVDPHVVVEPEVIGG